MLAVLVYIGAAVSAFTVAAFGLLILLGGSAELGREIAIVADKALHPAATQNAGNARNPGNDVSAAATTTGTAIAEQPPSRPKAVGKPKRVKAAAKRKARSGKSRTARSR